jgi:hypothetical protein
VKNKNEPAEGIIYTSPMHLRPVVEHKLSGLLNNQKSNYKNEELTTI